VAPAYPLQSPTITQFRTLPAKPHLIPPLHDLAPTAEQAQPMCHLHSPHSAVFPSGSPIRQASPVLHLPKEYKSHILLNTLRAAGLSDRKHKRPGRVRARVRSLSADLIHVIDTSMGCLAKSFIHTGICTSSQISRSMLNWEALLLKPSIS